ncbi:MAG: CsbD family protein [Acidimicrobiales bacterium]
MGVFEEAKGKAKEVVGDITDNADLKEEGRAQKDKGEAEHEANEARAKAKAHEAEAKEKELEQKAAQDSKD